MSLRLVKIDATDPYSGYKIYCDSKYIEASEAQGVADDINNQEMNAEVGSGLGGMGAMPDADSAYQKTKNVDYMREKEMDCEV